MQVAFDLTKRDLRAYFDFMYSHDRRYLDQVAAARRTELQWLGSMSVFFAALAFETFRIATRTAYFPIITGGTAVAILVSIASLLDRRRRWSRDRLVSYALQQSDAESMVGPATIRLEAEGVTHESRSGRIFQRWSTGIDSIAETADHIFIFCHPTSAFLTPRTAFASPADATAFARMARDLLVQAGGPEHARDLLRYLAVNDEPCPACGYNLRNITQPRCPECGRQIVGRDLPNFRKFGPPALPPRDGMAPRA